MLRVSLRQLFADGQPRAGFYELPVMTRRPEQLSIEEFVELTKYLWGRYGSHSQPKTD